MRCSLSLLALLLVGSSARASEEEFLVWSEVRIVSVDRKDTGRVTFTAEVRDDAWRKVEATAFDKTYSLTEGQCARLAGFPLSSIRTTHEAGYEQLGGHTVHFKFKRSFYRESSLVESELVISISRGRGLKMSEPRDRVVTERKG